MTERVLGPTGSPRRRRIVLLPAVIALVAAVVFGVTAAVGASLPGSNFEIDNDANLTVQGGASALDWANVSEVRRQDTASGSTDESFGQGAKEDSPDPAVVDGGIPPNKSDLKFFGVYQEGTSSAGFLNLFWARVQDPSGTTNMDFEFNKRQCTSGQTPVDPDCSGNGITPIRSSGDLLVIYDLAQGGTNPILSLREWNGTEWGAPTDLTASSKATGSINTTAIAAGNADGLGALSARTFGEAQLAISAIFPPGSGCTSFGSAYLKSRSSDSFTAALKDFVPPVGVNITNCGAINIHKQDDAGTALQGAVFTLYVDNAPLGGSRGAEDTITTTTCSTNASGDCSMSNVPFGRYWVVETTTPPGYTSAADQNVTLSSGTATLNLVFVNVRQPASIKVKKVDDDSPANPLVGAVFTLYNDVAPVGGTRGAEDTITTLTCTTNAIGECTISNILPAGNFWVVETTTPTGYITAPDRAVTVTQGQNLDLTGTPFVNPRKFKVIVLVCRESSNTLYSSAVTIEGQSAGNSLTSAGLLGLGASLSAADESALCGITSGTNGARGGLQHGNRKADPIAIPQ